MADEKDDTNGPRIGKGRPGPGRPKGVRNKRTIAMIEHAKATGELPHEFLLRVSRGEKVGTHKPTFAERITAAEKAAPYYAPKLSSVTQTGLPFDPSKLTDDELEFFERVATRLSRAGHGGPAPDGAAPAPGTEAPEDHGTQH